MLYLCFFYSHSSRFFQSRSVFITTCFVFAKLIIFIQQKSHFRGSFGKSLSQETVLWNTQINPFPPLKFSTDFQEQPPIWTEINPSAAVAQAEAVVNAESDQQDDVHSQIERYVLPHIPASTAVKYAGNTAKHASSIIHIHNKSAGLSQLDKVAKHAFEMGTRTVVARRQKDGLIPRNLVDEWNFVREMTRQKNSESQPSNFRATGTRDSPSSKESKV